jgi:hypothetical protein
MAPSPTYDLFVSYADADRTWMKGYLIDALKQAGVRYRSEASFALGVPRIVEFDRAIKQSQRTLLILSPAYLTDTFSQFADLLAQTYGIETAIWPIIPLVLHPVTLPSRDMWDLTTRDPVAKPIWVEYGLSTLAVSRDVQWLVSVPSSMDGSLPYLGREVLLWSMRPEALIDRACEIAGRNLTKEEWRQYFPGEPYRKTCSALRSSY